MARKQGKRSSAVANSRDFKKGQMLMLDCGGGYVRVGYCHRRAPLAVEPNISARVRVSGVPMWRYGREVAEEPMYRPHRPFERGLLVDIEQQRAILEAVLGRPQFARVEFARSSVLVTEAPGTPQRLRNDLVDMLFETFGFESIGVVPAPLLALRSPGIAKQLHHANPCRTVLDVGFSGCVATPCINQMAIPGASIRSFVGGGFLTALLSRRLEEQYDLSENALLVEDVLKQTGHITPKFQHAHRTGWKDVDRWNYVLPDYVHRCTGEVEKMAAASSVGDPSQTRVPVTSASPPRNSATCSKKKGVKLPSQHLKVKAEPMEQLPGQRLRLRAECVAVPEALFRPQDHLELKHQGLVGVADVVKQAMKQAIRKIPDEAVAACLGQVVVCGGLARIRGFRKRLQQELREELPDKVAVAVISEDEPELSVWRGGCNLLSDAEFLKAHLRSREEWRRERYGSPPRVAAKRSHKGMAAAPVVGRATRDEPMPRPSLLKRRKIS